VSSPLQSFLVPATDAGQRLDQWLAAQLPDLSRVRIQQLIEQEKVSITGRQARPSLRLRGGEEISVTGAVQLPPLRATAEDIPLDVIYEDDDLVVVNKPAGMMTHAGSGKDDAGNRGTLVNALLHRFGRFGALSQVGGELRPGIVHRLDKETSGLLIVAKNDKAHRRLGEQFSQRQVKKTYVALAHGEMPQTKGTINTPISRDPVRRIRMTARRADGRTAVTHWKVLRKIDGPYGRFSLLEVNIETGRTHQIRVHLSSIGHPIAGDTLYGAPGSIRATKPGPPAISLKRNFLHAAALQFRHPLTEKLLSFEQPLPPELVQFLGRLD